MVAHKMVREAKFPIGSGVMEDYIVDLYHRNIALKAKQTPAKPHKLLLQ